VRNGPSWHAIAVDGLVPKEEGGIRARVWGALKSATVCMEGLDPLQAAVVHALPRTNEGSGQMHAYSKVTPIGAPWLVGMRFGRVVCRRE